MNSITLQKLSQKLIPVKYGVVRFNSDATPDDARTFIELAKNLDCVTVPIPGRFTWATEDPLFSLLFPDWDK